MALYDNKESEASQNVFGVSIIKSSLGTKFSVGTWIEETKPDVLEEGDFEYQKRSIEIAL